MRSACAVGCLLMGIFAPCKAVRLGAPGPGGEAIAFNYEDMEEDSDGELSSDSQPQPERLYQYFPDYDVAICSCAKCGSTTVMKFIYKTIFGHEWNYPNSPWVQEVSSRWKGKMISINASRLREVKTTFALRRDPKDRLVSAWKSKVACNPTKWGTDVHESKDLIADLYSKAYGGRKAVPECLHFKEFLQAIQRVHEHKAAHYLNHHFKPQNFICFQDMKPSNWTRVDEVDAHGFAATVARAFGDNTTTWWGHEHASTHKGYMSISKGEKELLYNVTKTEYKLLRE